MGMLVPMTPAAHSGACWLRRLLASRRQGKLTMGGLLLEEEMVVRLRLRPGYIRHCNAMYAPGVVTP